MTYTIDLNCDLGEGVAHEAELMPYLSSCSIACGAHAGDKHTIRKTIALALEHQVKIGAHPSFPDRENFGRKIINISPKELQKSIENQINLVQNILQGFGEKKLNHVKMHGALYNLSAVDLKTAQLVIDAFCNTTKDAYLYIPYNSIIQKLALEKNIKIKIEAFADRNYNSDFTLVSRKKEHALLTDPKKIIQHLKKMVIENKIISIDGTALKIEAQTYCIHGDNLNAKNILKTMYKNYQKTE